MSLNRLSQNWGQVQFHTKYRNRLQKHQYTPEETLVYAKKRADENRQRLTDSEAEVARLSQALAQVEHEYRQLEASLKGRGFFDLTFGDGARIRKHVNEVGGKVWQTREDLKR